MKRSPLALTILVVVGLLSLVNAILGNIVASRLEKWLGDYAWLVFVPFVLIAAVLLGFDVRDKFQVHPSDTPVGISTQDRARRNRQAMLDKVQYIWIDGVFAHSLYREVLIQLGLKKHPTAVLRPLELFVRHAAQVAQPLPANTSIRDVYERSDRALLILGAAGAGKTTLLLELTRDLLQRARDEEVQPIPVVFPLGSWTATRRPLAEWLIDELHTRYEVPPKIGKPWVTADLILPLLDGLDEVAAEHRAGCVAAINAFRADHGLLPLVITSRYADYDALSSKLQLQSAIVVEPLTREQVRHYLQEVGLKVAPSSHSLLWELLDTPLMLMHSAMSDETYLGIPCCPINELFEEVVPCVYAATRAFG